MREGFQLLVAEAQLAGALARVVIMDDSRPMALWIRWLPPAIWAVLILALSTRPDTFFFSGFFSESRGRQYPIIHFYLEIAVHLVQFGVFFLLVVRPLRSWALPKAAVLGCAFGATLALSLLNESVQAFTPTRMFDVWDMTVDALGAAIGALLVVARDRRKPGRP